MLTDIKVKDLKPITFKIDSTVTKKFRELCKKHKIKQVTVIENAMLKAIEELEEREDGKK